jgi:acetyl esterase/lipase
MCFAKHLIFLIALASSSAESFSQIKDSTIIRLHEGKAPGSEKWNWKEKELPGGKIPVIYNVVDPVLLVFRADESISTGKAVIILPGGGFSFLSIGNEGHNVAEWLNRKGITAFILKYRTERFLTEDVGNEYLERRKRSEKYAMEKATPLIKMALDDGKLAIAYVRDHATEWGLKKDQIGIVGFSAGAVVAAGIALTYDTNSRPDFVGSIYGSAQQFIKHRVKSDAPPLFIAAASNDELKAHIHSIALYEKWEKAKKSTELHIYSAGGHGFGMLKQGLSSDSWTEQFHEWIITK